jgi:hypothetical protein
MTSDVEWDPSQCYVIIEDIEQFHHVSVPAVGDDNFKQYGEYRHRAFAIHNLIVEDEFFMLMNFLLLKMLLMMSWIRCTLAVLVVHMKLISAI